MKYHRPLPNQTSPRSTFPPSLAAAVVCLCASAMAQAPLLRDIRQLPYGPTGNSDPRGFRDAGSRAFFVARSADGGVEPYVTDGTSAGTLRIADFWPGGADSSPVVLAADQGQAVLFVRTGPGQHEFVRTDGTVAGTQRLGTLGLADANYSAARLGNGTLILQQQVGPVVQCFATDLTAAGTVLLPGLDGFQLAVEQNGLGFGFGATSAGSGFGLAGYDLFAVDGTAAGSRRLATYVLRGAAGSSGPGVVAFQGRVYYLRSIPGGVELGSSDGTLAGTQSHGSIAGLTSGLFVESPLLACGNQLAFLAGGSLWLSDGTAAGTARVAGLPCDTLAQLQVMQGRLYFTAVGTQSPSGFELWSSDGTVAGTAIVAEVGPGPQNGSPNNLVVSPQGLWLRAVQGVSNATGLYLCTGPQNLQFVGSLPPGTPPPFAPFGGGVLMNLPGPQVGYEPYFATPSQPPTLLRDLYAPAPGIDPFVVARGRDRLYFCADDGVHGRELWSTDGTAAGTTVIDQTPGALGTFAGGREHLVSFRDGVAVVAARSSGSYQLFVGDGSSSGLQQVPIGPNVQPYALAVRDDVLFAFDGQRIFRTDGSPAGTLQLPAMAPTFLLDAKLFALPGALVFGGNGNQLYGSDGVAPPVLLSQAFAIVSGQAGDRILFQDARGLVATDGTLAGTSALGHGSVERFEDDAEGKVLHFLANGGLHRTDGTLAGTTLLAPVPAGLTVARLVSTAGSVYLLANTAGLGTELWRYDAASSQITLVVDLVPGPASGPVAMQRLGDGDTLLLLVDDPALGREAWLSDGTAAGTRLLADIELGPNGSSPQLLGIAGGNAFLLAHDNAVGTELRVLSLAVAGAASLQRIAAGCPGSTGSPALNAPSAPRLGASGFGYTLQRVPPTTLVALLVGDGLGRSSLLGCEVAPTGATTSRLGFSSIAGAASFALPLPNANALLGLQITAQGFGLDPAAPRGFSGSDGMFTVIGR